MTTYEAWNIVVFIATALLGLIALFQSGSNLKELVKQVRIAIEANQLSRLSALLGLEDTIAERRLRLSEAGIQLTELGNKQRRNETIEPQAIEIAELRFNEAKEMYLNSLDRLCFCLIKGFLIEEELRAEYRETITDHVQKDFKDDFGTGTQFRNIVKIYQKWVDS